MKDYNKVGLLAEGAGLLSTEAHASKAPAAIRSPARERGISFMTYIIIIWNAKKNLQIISKLQPGHDGTPQQGKFYQLKICQKFNFRDFSKILNHDTPLGST